jgi:uncharacterized protein with gpF-like domain
MISELYLKKAANIRKEYLKVRSDIESYEKVAKNLIQSIEFRKTEMEKLMMKLEEGKFSNPHNAQMEFSRILFDFEKDINETNVKIDGLNSRIEKLGIEEHTLYKDIKNQYPGVDDKVLKEEIQNYFKRNMIE